MTRTPTAAVPDRLQMRVLAGVYRHANAARQMAAEARAGREATGELPPLSWTRQFRSAILLGQELEKAGAGAGVPREWLTQVRTRAHLGQPWRRDLHWHTPRPVNRDRQLIALAVEAHRIQDVAAVVVAYGDRGAHAEPGTATWVVRNLRRSRTRLVQQARLLGVTDAEADRLWNSPEHWDAVADRVREAGADELDTRWRAHARSDQTSTVLQARALTKAGITAPANGALPRPDRILDILRQHLTLSVGLDPANVPDVGVSLGAAEGIEAAVAVTGIDAGASQPLEALSPQAMPSRPDPGVEVGP
ncbi:hypothetical protein [Nocardia nova]|uniref:hypothetical protein n=1 Tax=Nocardia nova TaxID=37330 RepID=UPI0033EAC174